MAKFDTTRMKNEAVGFKDVKWGKKPSHYKNASGPGAHYEHRVVKRLEAIEQWQDWELVHNPWITYVSKRGKFNGCEPDILTINHDKKVVVCWECKMAFWAAGIKELQTLYIPLLKELYKGYEIYGVCVSTKPFMKIQNPLGRVTLEEIIQKHPQPVIANTR